MRNKLATTALTLLGTCLLLAGCGRESGEEPAVDASAESAEPAGASGLARTASVEGAEVYFITPADGDTVSSPVTVEFGVSGMSVVEAGNDQPASGHHHLIIDAELPPMDAPIPATEHYVHYGDASTATELTLEPGEHTLQLLLGDYLHIPHDPPVMSDRITITVE